MEKWIANVKANKNEITKEVYKWAGERFIKTAVVVGITWAVITVASGWFTPDEIKEMTDD